MAIRAYGKSLVSYDTWAALTAYTPSDRVVPVAPDEKCYECTTAGTSAATEPSWDSTVGNTTPDGTVVWTCNDIPAGANPLTVQNSSIGQGGLALLEIWLKSDISADFLLSESHDGSSGTWRDVETLSLPYKGVDNRHKGYLNAYHFIKVSTDDTGQHEIEIIMGEM